MLLGLHSYSFHLHGMGQNWGGFENSRPKAMTIFYLIAFAEGHGLDGLHITAADCETTEKKHLREIREAAEKTACI